MYKYGASADPSVPGWLSTRALTLRMLTANPIFELSLFAVKDGALLGCVREYQARFAPRHERPRCIHKVDFFFKPQGTSHACGITTTSDETVNCIYPLGLLRRTKVSLKHLVSQGPDTPFWRITELAFYYGTTLLLLLPFVPSACQRHDCEPSFMIVHKTLCIHSSERTCDRWPWLKRLFKQRK